MAASGAEQAAALREEAAKLSGARQHSKAVDKLTQAIKLDGRNHVLWGERSRAHLALDKAKEAENDAKLCVRLSAGYALGHVALGLAAEAQDRFADAIASLQQAVALDATLAEAQVALSRCQERQAALHEAIQRGEGPPPTLRECLAYANEPIDVAALPPAPSLAELAAAHPLVKIVTHPRKGRMLVAAADVPALSTLVEEHAVAYAPPAADAIGALMPRLMHRSKVKALREGLESLMMQLAPFSRDSRSQDAGSAASGDASVPPPRTRLELFLPVCARNLLGARFDDDAPSDERHIMLLCPVTAMINHSCAPNASYCGVWVADKGVPAMRVVSERPLKAGEEVTISYLPRGAKSKQARQEALARYGFTCDCPRCTAPWDDSIVFRCSACKGRIFSGATACADCGVEVGEAAAPGGTWHREREVFLLGNRNLAAKVRERVTVVHESDRQWLDECTGTVFLRLWSFIDRKEASQCADIILANPAAADFGLATLMSCWFLAGHLHAVAGEAEAAAAAYGKAEQIATGLYGREHPIAAFYRKVAAKPPTSQAEVERVETKRAADTGSWRGYGLSDKLYTRWRVPLQEEAAATATATAKAALAKEAAAMTQAALDRYRGSAV